MQNDSDFGLIPVGHTDMIGRRAKNHRKHDFRAFQDEAGLIFQAEVLELKIGDARLL